MKSEIEIDHQSGLRPLSLYEQCVGYLASYTSRRLLGASVVNGTYGLSEKTRSSYYLQMPLQRQHFLLSYLKTLSVGPAWI